MASLFPSAIVLGLAALAALLQTLARPSPPECRVERGRARSRAAARHGGTGAFFAAWFLAIAGMVNALAHPSLAVAAGGYFPGLVSAPLVGVASFWLWLELRRATRPARRPAPGES